VAKGDLPFVHLMGSLGLFQREMCGIVGYTGPKSALPILLSGLHSLEYRGYDSAGIALLAQEGLWLKRRAGRVSELEEAIGGDEISSGVGIGHTRWATCGAPNEPNAHPHRDCSGRIAVVHNGIIENHMQLRRRLEEEGHEFRSDTDTETLAHLVEDAVASGSDLAQSVRSAVSQLEGSYAIVVVSATEPGRIIAARSDAPLILGLGEGENFVASDVVALIEHTRRVVILEDHHLADVTSDNVRILDADGDEQPIREIAVTWDLAAAEKGGFEHFMLKEIHEQPAAVRETLRGRVDAAGHLNLDEMRMSEEEIRDIDKVFVVACGSSFHAGLVAKYALEHWTRLPVEIDVASEFRYRDPVLNSETLVVGISQSGETADTLAALRYAQRQKAKVISITNVVGSSITRDSDAVIYTHAGPEIGVAATKTLTTQMTALWLLALWVAQTRGTMFPDERRAVLEELARLPLLMEEVLSDDSKTFMVSERFKEARTWLFIGRGVGFPVAMEGALKLKEISYLHAEGFAAGEMKHGPIALLEDGVPVVAVASKSHVHAKLLSNIEEAKARGAVIVAVGNPGDDEVAKLADELLEVPHVTQLLSPALDVLPLQLLAYHVAKARGLDPDKPRNLAKSVTVE